MKSAVHGTMYNCHERKLESRYLTLSRLRGQKRMILKNVIYCFKCRHCESRYVGRTSQHLVDRVKQHVPRYLLPSSNRSIAPTLQHQSAIARHLAANADCRKTYLDSDFRILARSRSSHHLQVLEATYIHAEKPTMCQQKSFVTFLQLYKEAVQPPRSL